MPPPCQRDLCKMKIWLCVTFQMLPLNVRIKTKTILWFLRPWLMWPFPSNPTLTSYHSSSCISALLATVSVPGMCCSIPSSCKVPCVHTPSVLILQIRAFKEAFLDVTGFSEIPNTWYMLSYTLFYRVYDYFLPLFLSHRYWVGDCTCFAHHYLVIS